MPMFSVPKPRQFNYRPRFYDPRKEQLEELKRKYADHPAGASQEDVEYFERRVRELDEEEQRSKLTWKDAFRKRKMPKFEYKPRFATFDDEMRKEIVNEAKTEQIQKNYSERKIIKRRFDYHAQFDHKYYRWFIYFAAILAMYYVIRRHTNIVSIIYDFFY